MYQSVMAKRMGSGTSGTGFAFVLVEIREVHADKNICLARDVDNNASYYELGLNKRGETAWPQVGDRWIIDRSLGHWALQAKVTETEAPKFTGNFSTMDADLLRLLTILKGLGLVQDATTAGTVPAVTGSKDSVSAALQSVLSILEARGILDDQTTAETVPVGVFQTPTLNSPWDNYSTTTYRDARYIKERDGWVTVSGLVKTTADVSGTQTLWTMPTGYRPLRHEVFPSYGNGNVIRQLEILNTGAVRIANLGSTPDTIGYTSLSCRYPVF